MAITNRSLHSKHFRHRDRSRPSRARRLFKWLSTEAARLVATATGKTVTVAGAVVTSTAHGYVAGYGPLVLTAVTAVPTPYVAGTHLFVNNVIDANSFNVSAGFRSNTNFVFTNGGTGALTLTAAVTAGALLKALRRKKPAHVRAAADIDAL